MKTLPRTKRLPPALETAVLLTLAAVFLLPAVAGAAVLLIAAVLWFLGRPPRREAYLVVSGLVATAALVWGGAIWERRAEPSEPAWLASVEEGYAAFLDELEDAGHAAVASLYEIDAEERTRLTIFDHLQRLVEEDPLYRDKTLVFYDPDGEAVAWAGPGLLHEPEPEELPVKGLAFRRGYFAVTLYTVVPLDSTQRAHRLLVGRSFPVDSVPFAPGEPPGPWVWSLGAGESVGKEEVRIRPRDDGPALFLLPRAVNAGVEQERPRWWTPAWWAEALDRLAPTVLGLVYLTLAFLRGVLPVVASRDETSTPANGDGRRALSAGLLTTAGIAVLGGAARLAIPYHLAAVGATALAAWGFLRRRRPSLRDSGAELPGGLAVLVLTGLAWWFQSEVGLCDLADNLGGGDEVLALRLTGCFAALGLLSLAGWHRGPALGDRSAWTAVVFLLAAAATHDWPLGALPLLSIGGAATARWLRGLDLRSRPMAMGGVLLLAAMTAATSWEIAYREHFRRQLETDYLPRVAPPSRTEANDLHTEIHDHFEGYELRLVMPPGVAAGEEASVDPQDLAFTLWRSSPLPKRDGASALVITLEDGSRSSFSFGLQLDRDLRVKQDPESFPIPRTPAWHDAIVYGEAPLLLDGRLWGQALYTFMPRPGFRLEVNEISELESALVRGAHRRAADGLPRPVLFGVYDATGDAISSPWEGTPPLEDTLLEAGRGTARLPAGRFWYFASTYDEVYEVLFLEQLGWQAGLERVWVHALGSLLVISGLVVLTALPRSLAVVRHLLDRVLYSYSIRLMLVYTALLLLPLVALNLVLLRGFEERLRRDQQDQGLVALSSARLFLLDYLRGVDPGFSIDTQLNRDFLKWVSQIVRHPVNLYWGSRFLESSQPELFTSGLLPERIPGEVFSRLAILRHEVGSRTRHSGQTAYLELYTPLDVFGGSQGLYLSVPLLAQEEEVARELEMIERRAVLVTTALFILLLAVGSRLARSFTTPIMALIDGTREIADGAGFLSVTPREHELGKLADAIDDMARHIAEGRRELLAEKLVVERMVENITSAVVSLDHERRVLLHNRVARELLGTEVGQEIDAALDGKPALAPVAEFLAAGDDAREATVELAGNQGEVREWTLTWVPIPGPDDPAALLVVDDATEVLRGQRLEAWAEMARIIAHEIKNPLTPIRLSAEHMQQVYRNDPERLGEVFERCTDNILKQVEELRDIASDFSIYSRIPRAELAEGDLVAAMKELVDAYHGTSPEGIDLTFEADGEELSTRFDPKLLGRAVRNLLENALRATAGKAKSDETGVKLRVERRREEARISVLDSGPGVEPENLARIFDPYFSTHETGTGLGLAISKRIVEEHAGVLEAHNRPGGGLVVTITIPRVEARIERGGTS